MPAKSASRPAASNRRAELLALAAESFAQRGFVSTTVRDIADSAGILSGSLYHHFDSKEQMVDEILRGFLDKLFAEYARITAADLRPKEALRAAVRASFQAIHDQPTAVAIYQNEARGLADSKRFAYIGERNVEFRDMWRKMLADGLDCGDFRSNLDIEVTYRFIRDTVWLAVRWYHADGPLSVAEIADQYLGILLDGIGTGPRAKRSSHG